MEPRIASFSTAFLARNTASATACAPFVPSGWLCVGAAERAASASTASTVRMAQATGLTRIAPPLP
jgi:hypothetical protein